MPRSPGELRGGAGLASPVPSWCQETWVHKGAVGRGERGGRRRERGGEEKGRGSEREGKSKGERGRKQESWLVSLHPPFSSLWASLLAQTVKNLPAVQETQVQSLGQEYLLENGDPLRYSCPGNSTDRGALWATVLNQATNIHLSLLWMSSGSSSPPLLMSASQIIRFSNSHSCLINSLQITPFPCN